MEYCKIHKKLKSFFVRILFIAIALSFMLTSCTGKDSKLRNSQAYNDALECLEQDIPVIIFLLDGLGYMQYEAALEAGKLPFISSFGTALQAETYYPSISPVGLAAMATGEGPARSGIKTREDKELKVDDIFVKALNTNKSSVLIEGDIKLINTSVEPYLNPDLNGDGLTDDEVLNTALNMIDEGHDLIFIHFHGIDDISHIYGPLSEEAMDRIYLIDGYIEEILSNWEGSVIISSDHGQHTNNDGAGEHGTKEPEDMLIPYFFVRELSK